LTPAWLELVLASQKYQKQLDSLKVGSSDSSVSIGNSQVLELEIPIPSLDEQRRFIAKVQQVKELSARFELEVSQESQRFKLFRRSLLSAAFMGNLGIE
jgi:restriction endonuclease S subunit